MKKDLTKSLFIFVVSFMSVGSLSTQNLDQVLQNQHYPVDFLGLDFSEFKFIGNAGVSGYTMKTQFFDEWNHMFYAESKYKYNIGAHIKIWKKNTSWSESKAKNWRMVATYSINHRTGFIADVNRSVDAKNIVLFNNYNLEDFSKDKLQEVINSYNLEFTSPIALTFIVNYFNWLTGESKIAAVFFNTNTKEILLSTSLTGEGTSRGNKNKFRNFWANSIAEILGKLEIVIRKKIGFRIN